VHGGDDWEQVTIGRSGADVRRSPDGAAYAKSGTGLVRRELVDERDRLEWLAGTDLPAARVLDWTDDGETATLTTSAVPGVAMSDLPARSVPGAVTSLGRFLGRVHAVRRESCPFERWLSVTVPIARLRVDRGLVDTEDFDHERDGRSAPDLLDELVDGRPRAEELELGDLVVCHGDACLPNFLVDADSLEVTGMIDVHRLGIDYAQGFVLSLQRPLVQESEAPQSRVQRMSDQRVRKPSMSISSQSSRTTSSTCALDGPCHNHRSSFSMQGGAPMATTSTRPSSRFLA